MTTVQIDTRFSTFLAGQTIEPSVRQRQLTSAAAAVAALSIAGALAWTGDKLGIRPVDPPTLQYAVTLDLGATPPPPAPVPKAPKQAAAAAASATPDEPVTAHRPQRTPEPSTTATETAELDPTEPVRGTSTDTGSKVPGTGVPGIRGPGGPGGPPGGPPAIGSCEAPPCVPFGRPTPVNRTPERIHKPVGVVKANAIFSPDPDQRRLARTKTGIMRRTGRASSSVSFCVTTRGSVTDVRTTKRFPGDPEIDRICREAVSKWRFNAFVVDGKRRKTCTTTTFQIEFD